ncbi:MAG: hypothetical protein AAF764_09160 [Pseudomonadota bacterium]
MSVHEDIQDWPQATLRPPAEVMRLSRMGVSFPTRLSFLRSLLRDLAEQAASVETASKWDSDGFGHATFAVKLDGRDLTLIAWTSQLDDADRSDRVIATAWDACFVLFDGKPTPDDIEHLGRNAKTQEAGRYHPKVLVVSRANKSVRLFAHVVDALAAGRQPDMAKLDATGYLMRTTAVYGNGKFGMADREAATAPFRLEMLAVYLIREFTFALANHIASARNSKAARLGADEMRALGIGNSTGLGMAPFLVSHPVLLNNWVLVRETAIARVRAHDDATKSGEFQHLCERAAVHLQGWNVDDEQAQVDIEDLRVEFRGFREEFPNDLAKPYPWDAIMHRAERGTEALQELIASLVLEPHGELIDGLCHCMGADDDGQLRATGNVGDLRRGLEEHYRWALDLDLSRPEADAMVWYVSEEKLEPRLGERAEDFRRERAMPHDIARQVQAMAEALANFDDTDLLATFLMRHPRHRNIVKRVQTIMVHPYGEIRDNLVAVDIRPIDLLRCKLAFFGASRFDPRSDRWTRITLYAGAPPAAELTTENAGDCFLPVTVRPA